jgi:hypothetical protein
MANLSKAVCHVEIRKYRFRNPPQESNFQRLSISMRGIFHQSAVENDERHWAFSRVPVMITIVRSDDAREFPAGI